MKWFHDAKIATKLIVSFIAVLLLMAQLGIMSIVKLAEVNQTGTDLANNWMPSIQRATEIRYGLSRFRAFELQHILSNDVATMADFDRQLDAVLVQLQKDRQAYEQLISEPEEHRLYAELSKLIDAYMAEHNKLIVLSRELKTEEATVLSRGEASRLFSAIETTIGQIIKVNREGGQRADALGNELYASSRITVIALLIAATVLGMTLAWWLARSISRSLGEAVTVARTVASGDLTSRIEVRSKDETGQLMEALKAMNDSLAGIVAQVRSGTDTIATASSQIASGNLDLSSRTEEQASSLEETASSMEELTSTVRQNADNAREANGLVQSAATIAAQGGAVVEQVVQTMGSINDSSRKIVDIISVIDGIAFQTNILALNAAVEAARAGEQGRGFAVVAGEVRTLAQRSAAAAKEIKTLIDDSVGKIDLGSKLVDQAGATMTNIVQSVGKVADIMGDISHASHEQTSGIEQINQAIVQMDQVTQQNAALVEEASAAAEAMQEQAAKLSEAVSVFKLDAPQRQATQPAAVKRPAPRSALPRLAAAAAPADQWEHF